jgi:hypothetical protein
MNDVIFVFDIRGKLGHPSDPLLAISTYSTGSSSPSTSDNDNSGPCMTGSLFLQSMSFLRAFSSCQLLTDLVSTGQMCSFAWPHSECEFSSIFSPSPVAL